MTDIDGHLREQLARESAVSYELTQATVNIATRHLIAERGSELPPEYRFVCFELPPGDEYGNVARHIERIVFEKYFNNDAAEMAREYGPYESASRFSFRLIEKVVNQVAHCALLKTLLLG